MAKSIYSALLRLHFKKGGSDALFPSIMKLLMIFFVPLVYSELHSFNTTYTGIYEQTYAGIPGFSAETRLDGEQIDYYNSNTNKMIHTQDWMEEFTHKDMWIEDTEIREEVQQIYKNNIRVIMQRFSQSGGVHTYQRSYGCVWDDKTGDSRGFDRYVYDGQDFISLDVKELRYTAHVPQAIPTVEKWNNDKERFTLLKQYYNDECAFWMKYFLELRKEFFKRRGEYILVCVMGVLVICALVGMKLKRKLQKICQNLNQIFSHTKNSFK